MTRTSAYGKVLDLTASLSLDEKESLLEVLRQRTLRERRQQLARESAKARLEHRRGRSKPTTASYLMREITK